MYSVTIKNNAFDLEKGTKGISLEGNLVDFDIEKVDDRFFKVSNNGSTHTLELVSIEESTKTIKVKLNNKPADILIKDKFDRLIEKLGINMNQGSAAKDIKAPMPGLIFDIKVAEGDTVKKGDPVLILEAMKMENILKSPGDGVIKQIKIKKGDSVEKNQILIQF
ncbi:acetyl-CoA carboxylase biotin carboxyl carrier protein subunit [Mongoliitalea lutea]|uniref:Acetyl-CoA carboxylase biotin carboxyl carrier protein subunit n=1 Tax=Mongoliitalea lutea TaxID=849756 RepID=A0A8J3CXC1_9BACT|nr:acetyl-CoA carboxylase biotin carboxyl carrier protein subunit [Mongoliitalea lutea]GHB37811.1 acetyl-CoA carboxylase biotin carboxyl carrier protein subunit [Mongoliitalea lutea]